MIGKRIKQLIDAQGITQLELAKATKLTQAAISQFISDSRIPSTPTLNKLATALGVSVDTLLGRKDDRELAPEEAGLLAVYSTLSKREKALTLGMVRLMAEHKGGG